MQKDISQPLVDTVLTQQGEVQQLVGLVLMQKEDRVQTLFLTL